jgi:RHS repeat-associated protein
MTGHDEQNYGPSSTSPRGNATTAIKWLNTGTSPTTTYTYDEAGQPLSQTDPCGNATCPDVSGSNHTTTYSYTDSPSGGNTPGNSNAYLTTLIYPVTPNGVPHQESFAYNYTSGELASSTDENSKTTSYQYNDPLNRITLTTYPDGGSTQVSYNDSVPSITTTIQLNNSGASETQESIMDGMGHPIQTQSSSSQGGTTYTAPLYTNAIYDGSGHVYQQSNPTRCSSSPGAMPSSCSESTWGITTFNYDALGRKTLQINPDNTQQYSSQEQWLYSSNATTFTNEVANSWTDTSDSFGRLTQIVEPGPLTTNYTYDVLNNLLTVNQLGNSGSDSPRGRSFTYDSLSRLTQSDNPESGWSCYGTTGGALPNGSNCTSGYDANGNLAAKTDARAITVSYLYDNLYRLYQKTYSAGSSSTNDPTACMQYDVPGSAASDSYPKGRLMMDWTQAAGSACPAPSQPLSAPPGNAVTSREILSHDPMGRLTGEQQCPLSAVCTAPYPFTYTYDLVGDVSSATNGIPGTSTSVTLPPLSWNSIYYKTGQLDHSTVQSQLAAWNTNSYLSLPTLMQANSTSGYDAMGHLDNANLGISTANMSGAVSIARSYDLRGRFTSESDTGASTPGNAVVQVGGTEQVTEYSSGSISFSGSEQCSGSTCDSGTFLVEIGSAQPVSLNYGQNSTASNLASSLASLLSNCSTNKVYAVAVGATVDLQSCTAGANTSYSLSAIPDGHSSSFSHYSFTISSSGSAMTPILTPTSGSNAVTFSGTEQNGQTGGYVIFVMGSSGPPVATGTVSWGSSSTPSSLASALAASFGSCVTGGNNVGATAVGPTVYIIPCQNGASYTLTIELNYYSSGSGPDFTAAGSTGQPATVVFSGAEQGGQTGGLLTFIYEGNNPPDVITESWGSSSTPSTLAASLVSSLGSCSSNGNVMTGLQTGGTVVLIPCLTTQTYTVSAQTAGCSCGPGQNPDFSVTATNAIPSLPGVPGAIYDSGTVSLTVHGTPIASTTYGAGSTIASVINGLISSSSGNSVATVQSDPSNSNALDISASTDGNSTDYSYSFNVVYNNSAFSSASFAASPSSGSLASGDNTAYPLYNVSVSSYSPTNNVLSMTDSITGTWSFTYDPLNRLATAAVAPAVGSNPYPYFCWSYDSFGNRTGQITASGAFPVWAGGYVGCPVSGAQGPSFSATYNGAVNGTNRMNQTSWNVNQANSYDQAGDINYDGANYYAYDGEGRLCAAENAAVGGYTQYVYDAEGRRVAKGSAANLTCGAPGTGFSATNQYLLGLNGEQVTELNNSSGTMAWAHTNIWAGGALDATYDTKGLHFHLSDFLGTRRVQTDAAGATEEIVQSLPFGDGLSTSQATNLDTADDATEHHFTGKERDTESGNDYFKYRYLASSMGRWLSPDPSGLAHVDLSNPQELNLYSYVGNRPLTFVDLEGLCWKGFQWACDLYQMVRNRVEGYGFQTDDALTLHPNQRSQRKIKENSEKSYRKETLPAGRDLLPLPAPIQLQPDPYLGQVTVSAWKLTPMPPRLDPQDCLVPDAKGYHENAMLAWEKENGLPLSPSGPGDVNGGEGVSATYVQMKGGSFYVGDTAEKVEPADSELVPNASAGGAAGANNAAVVAAAFAEFSDCEGTR